MSIRAQITVSFLLVAALFGTWTAHASPLVFDFESGVQGWTLGTVDRVDNAPLGGDFAIFGQGSASDPNAPDDIDDITAPGPTMSLQLDLTGYYALTFSRLHVSPDEPLRDFVLVSIHPVGVPPSLFSFRGGSSVIATPENPAPNPDLRMIDLSSLSGVQQIDFVWVSVNGIPYSGYVDDVTFYPVPEPSGSHLLLLGLSALAYRAGRRTSAA